MEVINPQDGSIRFEPRQGKLAGYPPKNSRNNHECLKEISGLMSEEPSD
jgi:hypothetical protein